MKRLRIPAALNALMIGIGLISVITDSMRAEPFPSKHHGKNRERIPDGSYFIPPNEQNGRTETDVQILDGDVCFISVVGTHESKPFQIDVFSRDGIEVTTIRKGDDRRVIVSKAGEPIRPKNLTPEQAEELRAIGLTIKLYINTLAENHAMYRKEQFEQAGTGQAATHPTSESKGGDKPQPELEGRSR